MVSRPTSFKAGGCWFDSLKLAPGELYCTYALSSVIMCVLDVGGRGRTKIGRTIRSAARGARRARGPTSSFVGLGPRSEGGSNASNFPPGWRRACRHVARARTFGLVRRADRTSAYSLLILLTRLFRTYTIMIFIF
jgi:hypothetical protein